MDINQFHVPCSHLNETLFRATAKQQGIKLVGELLSCSGCLEAKGRRSAVPRGPGGCSNNVLGTVLLDLAGPYVRSLGGSTYMLMCVDSKSWFMMVYGLRNKAETLDKRKL